MGTEKPPQPKMKTADPGGKIGIVGVNWNSELMSLKVCNDYGQCYGTGAAFACQYAADKGASVINMSFGGSYPNQLLEIGINYACERGCVVVASMGNCQQGCATVRYPAAFDSVIAVGATQKDDLRRDNSSYGMHIDVVAPGESILTDVWVWYDPELHEGYAYVSGTSFAAPHVAGVAAFIKGQYKELYPYGAINSKQIMDVIRYSAEDSMYYPASPDTAWDDDSTGYGRINAFRALLAISRGEVNNDHTLSMSDVIYLINYLFKKGPPPVPVLGIADCNCSGTVSLSDVAYLINYLTKGGDKPPICYKWYY